MAVTVDGTVVEEEKVDLEIPQEKVDVKKADEAEPRRHAHRRLIQGRSVVHSTAQYSRPRTLRSTCVVLRRYCGYKYY